MAFLGLCSDDSLVNTLRDVFGANPVRVPERRIQPMMVLASNGHTTAFRGSLSPLLKGAASVEVDVAESPMASLSGTRSRNVDVGVGLKILEGFLSGLGLPAVSVSARFKGAKKVSFAFEAVTRLWVDSSVVGQRLSGRVLDARSPAATIFFDDGYQMLLVDSVIQSSDFNIKVESVADDSFSLDVPAIKNLVDKAKADVAVSSSSALDISFRGASRLTFAFSCLRFYVDGNGKITSIPPAGNVPGLAAASGTPDVNQQTPTIYTPDRVLLSHGAGMIDVQFPEVEASVEAGTGA